MFFSDLIKPDVPQILINREPLSHLEFDVELYGNCDDVIAELCTQLSSDWTSILEGFEHSPLDREKWKMFYDFCNERNETESEEDVEKQKTDKQYESENKELVNKTVTEIQQFHEHDEKEKSTKTNPEITSCTFDKNETVETGVKRKSNCACANAESSVSGSPSKKNKIEWINSSVVSKDEGEIRIFYVFFLQSDPHVINKVKKILCITSFIHRYVFDFFFYGIVH